MAFFDRRLISKQTSLYNIHKGKTVSFDEAQQNINYLKSYIMQIQTFYISKQHNMFTI